MGHPISKVYRHSRHPLLNWLQKRKECIVFVAKRETNLIEKKAWSIGIRPNINQV